MPNIVTVSNRANEDELHVCYCAWNVTSPPVSKEVHTVYALLDNISFVTYSNNIWSSIWCVYGANQANSVISTCTFANWRAAHQLLSQSRNRVAIDSLCLFPEVSVWQSSTSDNLEHVQWVLAGSSGFLWVLVRLSAFSWAINSGFLVVLVGACDWFGVSKAV